MRGRKHGKKNRLKELRQASNFSQKDFFENIVKTKLKLGVTLRTYQNWENSKNEIKSRPAQTLAEHFGVSVGYLLGYSDDNPMTFSSGEEFEKAEEELLKKLQNSDTAELKLSYQGNELTGIEEKFTSRSENEEEFLRIFSKLAESDKTLIRYLTEKLVKDSD